MAIIGREQIGLAVLVAGAVAAWPSVEQTVMHITDETYKAPEVRHGEGHVQYHMARETLITAGTFTGLGLGALAGRNRSMLQWCSMVASVAGFVAAMWSGGPLLGVWAPNRKALLVHVRSSVGLSLGVALLKPSRRS
jgi:hypothetical protein